MQEKLKVLFITAFGRSGTTILDNVLGQIDGFCSLGETQFLWDRSLLENRLCGCGEPFRECELWGRVAKEALDDLGPEELREMARLRDGLGNARLLLRSLRARPSAVVVRYVERLEDVYRAVQKLTGSRVLIDSSKSPSHGYVLGHMKDIELYVVHMVRNPRAVAFSWQKRKVYDPSGEQPMMMARLGLRKSGTMWLTWNLVSELLWRRSRSRYLLMRYEDFVAQPRESVERILRHLDEPATALPFTGSHTVTLAANHSVAGNPNRFHQGEVEIRRDSKWQAEMPASKQLAVVAWTWPLLARYGYSRPLVRVAEP